MWKYFSYKHDKKLACSCCGEKGMKPEFMNKLDQLRENCGFPFRITSGYRCPKYNDQVSSTGRTGPHTTGLAVDIAVSGKRAYKLTQEAVALGMPGIGIKQNGDHAKRFIHLDNINSGMRPWMWSY